MTPIEQTKKEIQALNKEGELIEKQEEKDGWVTTFIEFISKDKSIKIRRTFVERKLSDKEQEWNNTLNNYLAKIEKEKQDSIEKVKLLEAEMTKALDKLRLT